MLLIGICLCTMGSFFEVTAQEKDDPGMNVEGSFIMFGRECTWTYYYSDELFMASPDRYDHNLARLSLGLALAAGRHAEHPDSQDDYLIGFFKNLGFSRFETETYRTNPTADSIAYGLAAKKIGDTTVLACAVCGGDYGLEWASNLTVGDSVRSEGFEDVSRKVRAAIKEYLEKNSVTGRVKLWVTGYSRAGAVSNITAADFTDTGIFESVYAYTFATPRTTREPGPIPIFIILYRSVPGHLAGLAA